jgi:hypothetical protein
MRGRRRSLGSPRQTSISQRLRTARLPVGCSTSRETRGCWRRPRSRRSELSRTTGRTGLQTGRGAPASGFSTATGLPWQIRVFLSGRSAPAVDGSTPPTGRLASSTRSSYCTEAKSQNGCSTASARGNRLARPAFTPRQGGKGGPRFGVQHAAGSRARRPGHQRRFVRRPELLSAGLSVFCRCFVGQLSVCWPRGAAASVHHGLLIRILRPGANS